MATFSNSPAPDQTVEYNVVIIDSGPMRTTATLYAAGDVLCQHVKPVMVGAAEDAIAAEKRLRGLRQIMMDWAK